MFMNNFQIQIIKTFDLDLAPKKSNWKYFKHNRSQWNNCACKFILHSVGQKFQKQTAQALIPGITVSFLSDKPCHQAIEVKKS